MKSYGEKISDREVVVIKIGVNFPFRAKRKLLSVLLTLPPLLRPSFWMEEEDDAGLPFNAQSLTLLDRRQTGFMLRSQAGLFSILSADGKPIRLSGDFEIEPDAAIACMKTLAAADPIFGYACRPEERDYRNRITVRIGANIIEAWVGRNTERFIPGLYWLTLLSSRLAKQHHVDIQDLAALAISVHKPSEGQTLLQFYERPDDWVACNPAEHLDIPQIFNVEKVRPVFEAQRTFDEYIKNTKAFK